MPLQGPKKKTIDARKGGVPDPGLQPSLFEVEPQGEGIPGGLDHCQAAQPAEARAVDLKGANEYGLPAQLPLFEAIEPVPESKGAEAADTEGSAPIEGVKDAPEAFLKLVARIAVRAGHKEAKQEGG